MSAVGQAVRLEPMRWWHVEPVLAVERVLFPDEPWSAALFWSELGQLEARHYVVALHGPELVGYAGLSDYPDEAFVQTMAVASAAQGQGLGGRLLRALLEQGARWGHRTTTLEVRADNLPAQRLYAAHGFQRVGVRRGYYTGGIDAWVLTRRA